mgnify:CR=1 FL=1|jgi:hypothetical protein
MEILIDFNGVNAPVYVEYGVVTEGQFKGHIAYRFPNSDAVRTCTKAKFDQMSKAAVAHGKLKVDWKS